MEDAAGEHLFPLSCGQAGVCVSVSGMELPQRGAPPHREQTLCVILRRGRARPPGASSRAAGGDRESAGASAEGRCQHYCVTNPTQARTTDFLTTQSYEVTDYHPLLSNSFVGQT